MKYLSALVLVGTAALAACTATATANVTPPPPSKSDASTNNNPGSDAGTEDPDAQQGSDAPVGQPTPDACLDGQDMDADDVDISLCPPIPNAPASAPMNVVTVAGNIRP